MVPPFASEPPPRSSLDEPAFRRYRWRIFFITWLTYASYYIARKTFAVAKVVFSENPDAGVMLSRQEYGYVDACYLTAYALGQFCWGGLGDRIGPRRILMIGIGLGIIAASCTSFAVGLITFGIFAVVQGLGQSTGWPGCVKTISSWYSIRERGRASAWFCTSYTVGAAIAPLFAAWMMGAFGTPNPIADAEPAVFGNWRAAYLAAAVVLTVLLVLFWWLHRNRPEDAGFASAESYRSEAESVLAREEQPGLAAAGSWSVVAQVLKVRAVWLLALSYFSIKLTRYAFLFWGPKYVNEAVGVGAWDSAVTTASLPVAGILGVLVLGYVSDKVFATRRIPATVISLVLASATLLASLWLELDTLWMMTIFLGLVGFFIYGPDSIISATAAMDFGTKRGASTAAGFINGIGSIGAILGGLLPGLMTTEDDWSPLFWVFIVGLLSSAAIIVPLWKTTPPKATE